MGWNKERLQEVAHSRLAGAKLIMVVNREPYIHLHQKERIHWIRPAGGLTTALDPVMQACGALWVAHGSGDADQEVSDAKGRIGVPPDDPRYTLKRIWLTLNEEKGYYYGFANSSLWPLCHQVYSRPTFDPDHWDIYRRVNHKFAESILEEVGNEPALVFVQDYHFALLPKILKDARPDLVVAQFWHIPWPSPEVFRVCPWYQEIIEGMLGNDLLAFHIQNHCNNFLDTVDRTLECRLDWEHFSVLRNGHTTRVRPHPISVDPTLSEEYLDQDWQIRARQFRDKYQLGDRKLIVGVDRLDYTKGIPERLRAVDRLLMTHPEWVENFHFVQIAAPSRTLLDAYQSLTQEVQTLVDEINLRYGSSHWQPVLFLNEHLGPEDVAVLYRMSEGCVVSSLHDGMNLVAKEFVCARSDEQGVLVLSEFTGAARELTDAIIVNPYDVSQLSDGMHSILTMPAAEQSKRMKKMRAEVQDKNIYRWAGMLLSEALKLVESTPSENLEKESLSTEFAA
ncbi:trehalose-6-phosphate synthase [Telmatocola sphagniphila]|uniref:Trehalose-6-phosphate synthase n=1 Tax=Telmatocola sphagniphila TaxID=1123043 RepID=A0A8E6B7V0_9BACT|nr:trehalose-6-phosphate synthase [Telmatocola sphagniphila]QVL33492.1 trehalose-6-phosphate synthase [Telmatocola sphagniphila]